MQFILDRVWTKQAVRDNNDKIAKKQIKDYTYSSLYISSIHIELKWGMAKAAQAN
jgi:hypothetical protein